MSDGAQQVKSSQSGDNPWDCGNVEEFLVKLRAYRDERQVADHPFTKAMLEGRISREGIIGYLGQFCTYVERGGKAWLPWLIGNIPVGLEYRQAKNVMLDNMYGEFHKPADHVDLLLDMAAETFGVDKVALYNSQLLPETLAFMRIEEHFAHYCSWIEAVVALGFGLETQSPRYFEEVRRGLVEHYELKNTFYYDMHIEADVEHGDSVEQLIEAYATPGTMRDIWIAATQSIDAYQLWHDGLYRAYVTGTRP